MSNKSSHHMSEELEKELESVEKDIKEKKNLSPALKTAKDLKSHLKKCGR